MNQLTPEQFLRLRATELGVDLALSMNASHAIGKFAGSTDAVKYAKDLYAFLKGEAQPWAPTG
jgi:hypothetical protein